MEFEKYIWYNNSCGTVGSCIPMYLPLSSSARGEGHALNYSVDTGYMYAAEESRRKIHA